MTAPVRLLDKHREAFPAAPAVRAEPLSPAVKQAMAWTLNDLLRFTDRRHLPELIAAFEALTGAPLPSDPPAAMGDRLQAWDLPAPFFPTPTRWSTGARWAGAGST